MRKSAPSVALLLSPSPPSPSPPKLLEEKERKNTDITFFFFIYLKKKEYHFVEKDDKEKTFLEEEKGEEILPALRSFPEPRPRGPARGGGCSVGLGPGYAGWPRVLRRARKAEANLGYFFFSC